MANVNVVSGDNSAVKAKISEVSTAVGKSVAELGALFIGLCERFTGKDSQSGDNFQHLLNSLDNAKGAKRYQAAIIARLNDFSEKTIDITYDDEKKSYVVQTVKGADNKSIFKKEKFVAAVAAAKSAEFALNPPKKEETEPKAKRFSEKKAVAKVENTLKDFVTGMIANGSTPELLAIELEAIVKKAMLAAKPAIEGETA